MRHKVDPVELIRDHNPVPDAHQLPDEPNSASAEALFEAIIGMQDNTPIPIRTPSRSKIGRIAALAAAFLVVSAGAAVAAGVFSPDPEDVATIEEEGEQRALAHVEGWRPELQTESVWCMYDLQSGAQTPVSKFPLGEPLTTEVLLAECATGNDVARNEARVPTDFTPCQATFTDQAFSDRLAQDERFEILVGDPSAERPGFPVVLAWDAECAETTLETSSAVKLTSLQSLDDVNQARDIEIGLKAAAIRACLTKDEANAIAQTARADLGRAWLVIDMGLDAPGGCYDFQLDPQWGTIGVVGRFDGTQNDETSTPTTAPPTNN